jgi:hypothetical protein
VAVGSWPANEAPRADKNLGRIRRGASPCAQWLGDLALRCGFATNAPATLWPQLPYLRRRTLSPVRVGPRGPDSDPSTDSSAYRTCWPSSCVFSTDAPGRGFRL